MRYKALVGHHRSYYFNGGNYPEEIYEGQVFRVQSVSFSSGETTVDVYIENPTSKDQRQNTKVSIDFINNFCEKLDPTPTGEVE